MELQIIFVFCAVLLTAATQTEAKIYRKDYVYDWSTDAFYKLHMDSDSKLTRKEVCELEGAALVAAMSEQELLRVRASMNQQQQRTEEDGDAAKVDPIIDYSEAQDVLEMSCQVTTRDGHVRTSSVFRNKPLFLCKVEAKNVPYNSQCRVHANGYQYFPSVGSCYKIPRVAYTWHQAAAECQAEGAYLAVINSEQEALVLKNMTASVKVTPGSTNNDYIHLGFRAVKVTEPRVFKTIFDETLEAAGYSTWVKGEPSNDFGKEHCGAMKKLEGEFNDIQCVEYTYAFICEKEVTCRGN